MTTTSRLNHRWRSRLVVLLAVVEAIGGISDRALAQIVPDNTLGTENSVVTPNVPINNLPSEIIDGGAIRGANLFHSFEQFNIGEAQAAFFTNPAGIERIFSRVTGGSRSEIFGRLGVLGNADLFLINPNGIIFGANAQLNVGGSFLASTASGIKFDDNSLFSAKTQSSPLLTLNVPIGLQFDREAGSIVNRSQFNPPEIPNILGSPLGLVVQPGKTLALVGGEVSLEGGSLTSSGGRIELGSVADSGLVSLTPINKGWSLGYDGVKNFQDIQLSQQATVNTSSDGSGDIRVESDRLTLSDGSRIISFNLGSQPPGKLTVNARKALELTGTGTFRQDVQLFSTGKLNPSDLRNGLFSANFSTGGAGDIEINTAKLTAQNGAFVVTSTFGQAQGGNLTVNATDFVDLTASALGTGTGIEDSGKAGDVTINTTKLTAREGGLVSTSSLGEGKGGTITVNASDSVELIGSNPIFILGNYPIFTSLISGTVGTASSGDVRVRTGRLTLENGAQLSATTVGQGKGGNIDVQADSLAVTDNASITTLSTETGKAGDIFINVRDTLQANNGNITASALSSAGGDIKIAAGNIRLSGDSDIRTDVSSGFGTGGNIRLSADAIIALDDSDIVAFAQNGRGGNISLDTPAFFGFGYLPRNNANPANLEGNNRVDVNASGQLASGTINLPDVSFLQNSLTELPENLIDTTTLLANSCITSRDRQQGSFIITGSGNLPIRPGDASTSPYPTGTVRSVPKDTNSNTLNTTPAWKLGDPIVEPQGVYRLANGQLVLSRECH